MLGRSGECPSWIFSNLDLLKLPKCVHLYLFFEKLTKHCIALQFLIENYTVFSSIKLFCRADSLKRIQFPLYCFSLFLSALHLLVALNSPTSEVHKMSKKKILMNSYRISLICVRNVRQFLFEYVKTRQSIR